MRFPGILQKKNILTGGVTVAVLVGGYLAYTLSMGGREEAAFPLSFEKDSVSAGTVVAFNNDNHFVPIGIKFPFTVWNQGPVTITKVITPCQICLSFDQAIVGKQLDPGSTHMLLGQLKPYSKTAKIPYQALVETSPPFAKPKIIEVTCRGIVHPVPFPLEVRLELGIGDKPQTRLLISYLRTKLEPKLTMKKAACHFPGFTIVKSEFKSGKRSTDANLLFPPVADEIELVLQADKDYPLGVHESKWLLKWEGDEPDVELPVTIGVVHPVRPKLSEVFCGILQPAQEWKGEVPLSRREGVNSTLKAVKASQPYIQAQVAGKAGDRLEISLKAPVMPKRYQEHVEFVFDDSRYPPLRIPVVFLVQK